MKHPISYENNPFNVAIIGLRRLFLLAVPIAILTISISIATLVGNLSQDAPILNINPPAASNEEAIRLYVDELQNQAAILKQDTLRNITNNLPTLISVFLPLILLFIVFSTILSGILDYAAAQLARNKKVTLIDAVSATLQRFFPYLWLKILVSLKIFLWSLLLVVPGIIMSVRYSLAGVSFFDKNLAANDAIRDSSKLVKGAWLTTNGSFGLFNLVTFGVMSSVLKSGTSAVLYGQLDSYEKADRTKPNAHILSWLTLIIPYVSLVLFMLLVVTLFIILLPYIN